jgi:hypothetical protein
VAVLVTDTTSATSSCMSLVTPLQDELATPLQEQSSGGGSLRWLPCGGHGNEMSGAHPAMEEPSIFAIVPLCTSTSSLSLISGAVRVWRRLEHDLDPAATSCEIPLLRWLLV